MISLLGVLLSYLVTDVSSHGRLIEPPSRASMWRYGFSTPPNYNDHELYCGGFTKQWNVNGGKCGICGDPWEAPQPRPHEAGGKYAQGIIVRKYKVGSMFTIRVELTANHRGFFEFRLCPNNNPKVVATQECLDKHVLRRSKMSSREPEEDFHETRFYPGTENRVYEIKYSLPSDLTCTQCVLQWKYIAGNNWGICKNGTGAVGCGAQEEFRACADIQITDGKGSSDDTPYPTEKPSKPTRRPTTVQPTTARPDVEEGTTDVEIDNEIPDDDDEQGTYFENAFASSFMLYSLVMSAVALLIVLLIFAAIYLYYYHLDKYHVKAKVNLCDSIKDLSKNVWSSVKYLVTKGKGQTLGKDPISNSKNSVNVPIPPPRIKKTTTIGFKGVPDNLI